MTTLYDFSYIQTPEDKEKNSAVNENSIIVISDDDSSNEKISKNITK